MDRRPLKAPNRTPGRKPASDEARALIEEILWDFARSSAQGRRRNR